MTLIRVQKPLISANLLTVSNIVITQNGLPLETPENFKFYLKPGALVGFSAKIDGGESITIPVVKLVAQRQTDNSPNGEELYLTGSIQNGFLSAVGKFPESTNYKVTAERNNRAIARMFAPASAPFGITFPTIDFLS